MHCIYLFTLSLDPDMFRRAERHRQGLHQKLSVQSLKMIFRTSKHVEVK